MNKEQATTYWVTGLSGAGKTTIGKLIYAKLRTIKPNVVFLDGDILREVFDNDLGYSREDRRKIAFRNARICRLLSSQGIDVVCCTISMFDDVREWNRKNIIGYREIYLRVNPDILIKRNQKGLYTDKMTELVGFGIDMDEPKHPDLVIDNNGELLPEEICENICKEFFI